MPEPGLKYNFYHFSETQNHRHVTLLVIASTMNFLQEHNENRFVNFMVWVILVTRKAWMDQ